MNWSKATQVIALGRPQRAPGAPLNVPPSFATTFHAGGARLYPRDDGTPSWEALENVMSALEGGYAVAFSSGMAAAAAVFAAKAWSVLLVPGQGYAGVRSLARDVARQQNIECRFIDVTDTAATLAACVHDALVWIESPTNPLLDLADIPALTAGAHARGAACAVDNTFATPMLQNPIASGADFAVHSGTKYLSGHSDASIGIAVATDEELAALLRAQREIRGAVPGTMETYLTLRGLRTLPLRLEKAQANARELASHLRAHPAIERVRYPDFGAMLGFDVRGGAKAADALCEHVALIVHATSLGGVESSIERRGKYSSERYLPAGFVRMSVGCEDSGDLWNDLQAALSAL